MATIKKFFARHPMLPLLIPAALLIDNGCGVNMRQYMKELLSNGTLTSKNGVGMGANSLSQLVNIFEHLNNRDELPDDERELLEDFLFVNSFI